MTKSHFLNEVFKSSDLTKTELEEIIPRYKQIDFKKKEFLLQDGKLANCYWFLESGFVRSFVVDPDGNDITTNFYSKGDIVIDWSSFFLRNPTRENIQALTDCVCWELNFQTFQELFHSIGNFREQGRTTLVKSYFALKNHNVSMIADHAKERYLRLIRDKPQIVQNVSLQHIATYLGITKFSLSRIRKEIAQ